MLDANLARHASAPAVELVPALVYQAELAVRMGEPERATTALAQIRALELDDQASDLVAADLATADEIERDCPLPVLGLASLDDVP